MILGLQYAIQTSATHLSVFQLFSHSISIDRTHQPIHTCQVDLASRID